MTTIYTIGYEGTDISAFIAALKAANVKSIADLRALPLSRKRGFSKRALKARLEENGIAYNHYRELGNPKLGRDAAREGRLDEFRRIYSANFDADAAHELARNAELDATCLLCFERDPSSCHRSIVADWLRRRGMDVTNLFVGQTTSDERTAWRARLDSGEGASATE